MKYIETTSLKISYSDMADLLCAAFEGGVGYWACITGYKNPSNPVNMDDFNTPGEYRGWESMYRHIHYPLTDDGAIILEDEEGGKQFTLGMAEIKKGLQIFQLDFPQHFADFITENSDATTGDVFVQCCIFGELVYG